LESYNLSDLEEWDIWDKFPEYRWTFNKLELALKLGHSAGPVPKPVPITNEYVVRPIYNLSGMGVGAKILTLEKDKVYDFAPSLFWCERFIGDHLSINYIKENLVFKEVQTSKATANYNNLSRFEKWELVENKSIPIPSWVHDINVPYLNIEFINNKIIEIHLRWGIDFPEGASEIIPVWHSTTVEQISKLKAQGYSYVLSYMDAEKNLTDPRLGFLYK